MTETTYEIMIDYMRLDDGSICFPIEERGSTSNGIRFYRVSRENFAQFQARVIEMIEEERSLPENAEPVGAA